MLANIIHYLDINPNLYKLIFNKKYYNNFYKRNLAYNFYNSNGSLNVNTRYILKNGNELLGPLNILSIKKEYIDNIDLTGKLLTLEERISINITFVASNNITGLNLNNISVIHSITNSKTIKKLSIFLNNYPYLQIIKLDDAITHLDSHMLDKDDIIINDIVKIEKILYNLWIREVYIISDEDISNIKHIMHKFILPLYKTQMREACIGWLNIIMKRAPTNDAYIHIHMGHIDTTHINYNDDIYEVFEMFNITINDIPLNYNPNDYNTENTNITNNIKLEEVLHRIISLYYENK